MTPSFFQSESGRFLTAVTVLLLAGAGLSWGLGSSSLAGLCWLLPSLLLLACVSRVYHVCITCVSHVYHMCTC